MDYNYESNYYQPEPKRPNVFGIISTVVGGLGIVMACLIALLGYVFGFGGIVFAIIGFTKKDSSKVFAIVGAILSVITLIVAIINSILGAIIGATMFA